MKEKDIKKRKIKPNKLDIVELDEVTTIEVKESKDFLLKEYIVGGEEHRVELKRKVIFQFTESDLTSDVSLKIAVEGNIDLELFILVVTPFGIQNIESTLDMNAILLDDLASITFVPSLEIEEMSVNVDHQSTIGTPEEAWIEYFESRGYTRSEAIKFIADSFISDIES